ncbi:MAG: DNA mismatch repair protein MutS [Planctomycetes bacterium]|nr:DNA mismatch repair protein MutS [Planctomycetota bacterium]
MDRPDPRPIYEERLRALRARRKDLDRRDDLLAHLRLVVFVLLALAAWWALARGGPAAPAWIAALAFAVLVALHAQVFRRRERIDRSIDHFERGLRRLDDAWAADGAARGDFVPPDHPFAADLDLFGRGSLFDLLCAARTRAGEEALARWLATPAPRAEVLARQAAVEELRPRVELREELSVLAGEVRSAVDPASLLAWAEAPPLLPGRTGLLRAAALAAGLLVLSAAAGAMAGLWSGLWFFAALAFPFGLSHVLRRPLEALLHGVSRPAEEFEVLHATLARLEAEPAASPALAALRARLVEEGLPASARVRSLLRRISWLEALKNQLAAPLVAALALHVHAALAVDGWRTRHGRSVRGWLGALGEWEALLSLAGYAFEHPGDPFPEIVEGAALFEGTGLGHPLVPAAGFVRNSVTLRADGAGPALLLVSGSNMSGKSTLLRTVGVNAVLALCGAPVRAERLRMSPLVPGATLRIHDSLREGRSRFMAELERIRALVDLAAGPAPLLFLLDEVFAGTNSHDRRFGAEALLAALLERGALGLVSTHDLALSEAIRPLGPRAADVHFEDRLEGGRLVFDYRMRPGVVTRSNAVDLMRAAGLPV